MSNTALALAPQQETALAQGNGYNREQIDLIKDTYAKGATDGELRLFLEVANRKGLDIFSRQIHLVKRWEKDRYVMQVQTGIDGYRLMAERTRKYQGQTEPQWCGTDGQWVTVWLLREPPAAARIGVWKKDCREPYYAVALYSEYVQTTKDGRPNSMWAKMPANQLLKCAEALALRKAFPEELSGIYTQEEMGQADNGSPQPENATTANLTQAAALPELSDDAKQLKEQREILVADIKNLAKQAGLKTVADVKKFIAAELEVDVEKGVELTPWLDGLGNYGLEKAKAALVNWLTEAEAQEARTQAETRAAAEVIEGEIVTDKDINFS